jgi:hypothetical protein
MWDVAEPWRREPGAGQLPTIGNVHASGLAAAIDAVTDSPMQDPKDVKESHASRCLCSDQ